MYGSLRTGLPCPEEGSSSENTKTVLSGLITHWHRRNEKRECAEGIQEL